MAEILNKCVKCKCCLSAVDKTSKLLPCLHAMCEDCLSGRTDLEEKKRLQQKRDCKTENKSEIEGLIITEKPEPDRLKHDNLPENPEEKQSSDDENKTIDNKQVNGLDQETETEKKNEDISKETPAKSPEADEKTPCTDSSANGSRSDPMDETIADDSEKKGDDTVSNTTETEGKKSDSEKKCVKQESKQEESIKQDEQEAVVEKEEGETSPQAVPLTECPVCKEPFTDQTVIDNVFVRKKITTSDAGSPEQHTCTGCESNPAVSFCVQCDDWLCDDCVNAHKRVKMTKDHQLTPAEEAAANAGGSMAPSEITFMCKHHPTEKLSLFCEKCEILTCRDCQLLQHQEHRYHFLQDAADTYKSKLGGSLSLMKERRDTLKKCLGEIEQRLEKVKKEKVTLQTEILSQADIVVKAVRSTVWALLNSLHSFTDAASKRLSREVGDVGDLVHKFDHCITFMEAIVKDGLGSQMLYSKTFVEAKCRKVYHTQMEPQSLKGQLNLQYRHDVPVVLRFLSNIGNIYVNGTKYPPDKTSPSQPSGAHPTPAFSITNSQGSPLTIPTFGSPQNRNLLQMKMDIQRNAGSAKITPGASLPGAANLNRSWSGSQNSMLSSSKTPKMTSLLVPGLINAQRVASPGQPVSSVTMKLQHRPAAADPSNQLQQTLVSSQDGLHHPQFGGGQGSGGQSAMSLLTGKRHAGVAFDPGPDPSRPAPGGRRTPDRPLSNEGAAASSRVKSEHGSNKDCVITSVSFKGKKSPPLLHSTLGEMRKNLDDVIRSVPLDMGDNLEQISGSDSVLGTANDTSRTSSFSRTSSPLATSANSAGQNGEHNSSSSVTGPCIDVVGTEGRESWGEEGMEEMDGMESNELGSDSPGHQVKGYATGNSMPGFTLSEVNAVDPNDDYCAACHQGGDVLCCDKCPRVFHLQCHVPVLNVVPSGAFVCTLCEEGLVLEEGHCDGPADVPGGKRKAPTGLSDSDLKVCERILLELFCHPSSLPFQEPVKRAVPNYYKIITHPMDFTNIKCKLSRSHFNHYASVQSFLNDCMLVFKNCAIYNAESSEVGKAGKLVSKFFERLVARHMPELVHYIHQSDSAETGESDRKRRRLSAPSNA